METVSHHGPILNVPALTFKAFKKSKFETDPTGDNEGVFIKVGG